MIGYNQEILDTLRHIAEKKLLEFQQPVSIQAEKWVAEHCQQKLPLIAEVAQALYMSVRSLQRKLREEKTSFREIVDKYHRQTALSLLLHSSLHVNEVSAQLGYADTQAFRRWTGRSPQEVRRGKLPVELPDKYWIYT